VTVRRLARIPMHMCFIWVCPPRIDSATIAR